MNKNVLTKSIEVVGILFAAFGGFLAGIAPPEAADSRFAVGLTSFIALIILMIIAALARGGRRRGWITTACVFLVVAIAAGFTYWSLTTKYTFPYPSTSRKLEHIAGTTLTGPASAYRDDHPGISNSDLLAKFGGIAKKDLVWPPESVRAARLRLMTAYVFLVISIATAIFALAEGALGDR